MTKNTFKPFGTGRARRFLTGLAIACGLAAGTVQAGLPFSEFVDPNPSAGNGFGTHIVPLSTGNVVITSPNADVGAVLDAGAVYLFNGATGALISTLSGGNASDLVGKDGVIALANGNFVVRSGNWRNGAASNAGAVTWGSGITGVNGVVTAANSFVGLTSSEQVGGASPLVAPGASSVVALSNGNYVITNPTWGGTLGAVTWCDGATGRTGSASAANSLVGSLAGSNVGYFVTALTNGNYVVSSPNWESSSTVVNVGAVTWCDGATGATGTVSATNSLVGTLANSYVGTSVTALTNGNYVVSSPSWPSSSTVTSVGAVTWGDGSTTGPRLVGAVSATNSLVGSLANNQVGSGSVIALTNGNYVVRSPGWESSSSVADIGAVTWGNGATGTTGTVSATNSLVGSKASDQLSAGTTSGLVGVVALSNGNYVVCSPSWDSPASVANVGAVTWGDGSTTGQRLVGAVSASNSLVGSLANNQVGYGSVVALTNGNYVVSSPGWESSSSVADIGAVTWGNGATGTTGTVSATNSLVGARASDQVGSSSGTTRLVFALPNGNYVVCSPGWDGSATVANVGAVTWGDGSTSGTRLVGAVNAANSLVGSLANNSVGAAGLTVLANGNYLVKSPAWDISSSVSDVGAVTFVNGTTNSVGTVSAANSLVGSAVSDVVGYSGVFALTSNNYVVLSAQVENGSINSAGAATFGNGATGTVGSILDANNVWGLVQGANPAVFAIDDVNNTMIVGFTFECKVRVGSQVDGFRYTPLISSPTMADIAATTATLGGNVTSAGTSAVTERGVVYALITVNEDPLIDGSGVTKVADTGAMGVFTVPVTGLLPGQTYAFKAYATSADGTIYTSVSTFTTLAPEIVVEQPTSTSLVNGVANISFGGRPVGNASAAKIFTLRNNGTSVLTLTLPVVGGGNAGDFTVDGTGLLLTVPVAGQTTFSVIFTPGASGARNTTLTIASDDVDEASFTLALTGTGITSGNDTDGDGLDDMAEFNYSSFGFDPLVAQPDLVATLLNGANAASLYTPTQYQASRTAGQNDVLGAPASYGLYTLGQVQDLNVGIPLIQKSTTTGKFILTIGVERTINLGTTPFSLFPMSGAGVSTTINSAGKLEFEFPATGNVEIFRLRAQ